MTPKDKRGRPAEPATRGRPKKPKGAAFGNALKAAQVAEQEKRAKWQRGIEQNGHRKGQKFSLVHTGFLLVLVLGVLSNPAAQEPITPTEACHYCASLMHINWHYFMEVYQCWMEHEALLEYEYEKRGFGSPKHKANSARLLSLQHVTHIQDFIDTANAEGGSCSIPRIQRELEKQFDLVIPKTQLYRAVAALGYKYVHVRGKGKIIDEEARTIRIRKYIIEMHTAMKDKDAVIVYMDESYIHQNHALGMSWIKKDGPATVGRSTGKGKRLIIVHAITKNGPLAELDEDNEPIKEFSFEGESGEVLTCEMVFEAGKHKGDYHDNMDGPMFMKWLRERFVPTFKVLYGDRKCVLVLDNAPYHHAHSENPDYVSVSDLTKDAAHAVLIKGGIDVIHGVRAGNPHQWSVNSILNENGKVLRAPQGPSSDEMKAAVRRVLKEDHPEWCKSDVQLLFEKEGWELIFTPPYCPQFQPIELFWQHGKGFVAREYKPRRSMVETLVDLRTGWYGGHDSEGNPHSACDVGKLINHCNKNTQAAIDADPMLKGVLGDYLIMDEDVREESQTLDVSREGTSDPNFNDCLFVEDDCDEMEEEIEN